MQVILFESELAAKTYLQRLRVNVSGMYLALSPISLELASELKTKGYAKAPTMDLQEDRRDELVRHYIELIGEVNVRLNSRQWWATDFSSKNRFMNCFPVLLQQFLEIVVACRTSSTQTLLVFPVTWRLKASLRKFFAQHRIQAEFVDQPLRPMIDQIQRTIRLVGAHLYHFFRSMTRWALARIYLQNYFSKALSKDISYYVMKCFIYNHGFSKDQGVYRDNFYGDLPEYLAQQGQKVVFFANILGDFRFCLKRIKECPNAVIIPLEYFLSFMDIVKSYVQVACYHPQLKDAITFEGHDVRDLINTELAWGAGRIQPYQYLHFDETRGLLKNLLAKVFLMTYENNPWEKMCTLAIRATSPKTQIFSYQHTVNPQASVNMFHSRQEDAAAPKPDRVLAIGEVSKQVIEKYTQSALPVIDPTCALQFEHLWKLAAYPRTKTRTILLGLEGIFDVYQMVNYVLAQLKDSGAYKVIIRAHPVLPVKAMEHKFLYPIRDLSFVEISQGFTLLEDIARSDLMVYWGSMAALEAQWMGKPLIHFNMGTMFSYDALFASASFKWVVTPSTKLIPVLEEIYQLSDQEFRQMQVQAKNYLQHYFAQVTPEKLAKFLPG